MAIIEMPAGLRCASGCRIEQVTLDVLTGSEVTGSSQARPYGVPHWALSLVSPPFLNDRDAGPWKALLLSMRGSVNTLAAFDPSRPQPLGSLRGAPVLASPLAYGDTSLELDAATAQTGADLRAGDWLQVGVGLGTSQLVMVMSRAVVGADGLMSVAFEPPMRRAHPAGTALTYERPRAYFRKPAGRVGWASYSLRHTQGMALDLVEAW